MAKGKGARGSSWLLWIGIAALIVVMDQFTKVLILGSFQYGESLRITGYFNLVRVHNLGAAFSFLSNAGVNYDLVEDASLQQDCVMTWGIRRSTGLGGWARCDSGPSHRRCRSASTSSGRRGSSGRSGSRRTCRRR